MTAAATVTTTEQRMPVTAGVIISQVRAGMSADTDDPGIYDGTEFLNVTSMSARTAADAVSVRQLNRWITSSLKRMAVQMTTAIWSRSAGPAIDVKQQQRD
jgi:hypothetical protein